MKYRSNYWTPYTQRQVMDWNVDENIKWDEYYKALAGLYYTEPQMKRIEKKLGVLELNGMWDVDEVNKFFFHNVEKLMDFHHLLEQGRILESSISFSFFFSPAARRAMSIVLNNMDWVASVYFKWQHLRFSNPYDNYLWLFKNKDFIFSQLTKGIENPEDYDFITSLKVGLEVLCEHIVKAGATHKFKLTGYDIDEE